MGYASHSVDQLGPPFRLSDEIVFLLPKDGNLNIRNPYTKLLLVLEGEADYEIDGLPGRHRLRQGDLFCAPPHGTHTFFNAGSPRARPLHVLRLFYDPPETGIPRPETDFGDYVREHFRQVRHLHDGIDARLHSLIREFREEAKTRSPGYRHRIRSICVNLTVESARRLKPAAPESRKADGMGGEQIVNAAKEYILKHFQQPLTLGEIAWHVGKGEEHLARLFKRHTGQSVFDFVRETRVDAAKTLLPNPAFTLTRIAECCGFNSLAYFSRTFKEVTGFAPSRYRAHSLNTQPVNSVSAFVNEKT